MPNVTVNGVSLAYEVFGKGQPIVWTTQGWFPRDSLAYLVAGRLSERYRVLLWDRRNSGASDVSLVHTSCEHELWTEDLRHLMAALGMRSVYLAGACDGAALSLFFARRYPGQVKGLIIVAPPCSYTAATPATAPIFDGHFHRLAEVAQRRGMEAMIAESTDALVRTVTGHAEPQDWLMNWVAQTISVNPTNRDRLLAMAPKDFVAIMKLWASWYGQGPGHVHGIPYEHLRCINLPTLVAHGFDPIHPRDAAEELCRILPRAEWVEYSDRYTAEEIEQAGKSWGLALPFIEGFLARTEKASEAT